MKNLMDIGVETEFVVNSTFPLRKLANGIELYASALVDEFSHEAIGVGIVGYRAADRVCFYYFKNLESLTKFQMTYL